MRWVYCTTPPRNNDKSIVFMMPGRHECDWTGIRCDSSKNVTALSFENITVHGTIPGELGALSSSLQYLELQRSNRAMYGSLSGTLPSNIGLLTNLVQLDLENSTLTGTIPATTGELSNLTHLDLSHNKITGRLPTTLFQLKRIRVLNLFDNAFQGRYSQQ